MVKIEALWALLLVKFAFFVVLRRACDIADPVVTINVKFVVLTDFVHSKVHEAAVFLELRLQEFRVVSRVMASLNILLPPVLRVEHNCSIPAALLVANKDLELLPLQLIKLKGHLPNLLLVLSLAHFADIELITGREGGHVQARDVQLSLIDRCLSWRAPNFFDKGI